MQIKDLGISWEHDKLFHSPKSGCSHQVMPSEQQIVFEGLGDRSFRCEHNSVGEKEVAALTKNKC